MFFSNIFSKRDLRAIIVKSLRTLGEAFFGQATIVENFQGSGTLRTSNNVEKMFSIYLTN